VFVGSVFSPTYFAARQRDPLTPASSVCAINAVLYHRRGSTWALTEARPESIERRPDLFALSGSTVERSRDALVVHLDERVAPWGRRLRGRVRIDLVHGSKAPFHLDRAADHQWWPIGAKARAEVELDAPSVRFRGSAYHDCNFGRVPLEHTFHSWNWSRADLGDDVAIVYDVRERDGFEQPLGLKLTSTGVHPLSADTRVPLRRAMWGVERIVRSQGETSLLRTLEDTPFYTRSLLRTAFEGRRVTAVHESLSMERFVKPWVQCLLPFRIRRGWRA